MSEICQQDVSDVPAAICQVMNEVGWSTQHPTRLIPAIDNTARRHPRCLYFEGLLFGVPRDCFVCIDTHLVMLISCQSDYSLSQFLDLVKNGEPVNVLAQKPQSQQRGLFDEE
jgi:hypothetical protein